MTSSTTSVSSQSHVRVPSNIDILNADPIAIIILIPILDLFIYPLLRRAGISISPIRKICTWNTQDQLETFLTLWSVWGFMTASLAMLGAALLQVYIYRQSPCGYQAASCGSDADGNPIVADINVWLQVPVFFFIALSEILASITSLE